MTLGVWFVRMYGRVLGNVFVLVFSYDLVLQVKHVFKKNWMFTKVDKNGVNTVFDGHNVSLLRLEEPLFSLNIDVSHELASTTECCQFCLRGRTQQNPSSCCPFDSRLCNDGKFLLIMSANARLSSS